MLNKEVSKKFSLIAYFALFLAPIAKAQTFGGVLRNMGPAVSQVLDLIGQIFYPIGSGSLFQSSYGIVYAKLLIGGILYMLIELVLSGAGLFAKDEKSKRYARVISLLIVLISMIALPQDITMFLVTTIFSFVLLGAIIALGALALMFLKGDTRMIYFLRAVVFFVLAFLFSVLATKLETTGWFGI